MDQIQSIYYYGGTSDIGKLENNEDFFLFDVLKEDILLAIVADGAGSKNSGTPIQPAAIAATTIKSTIRKIYTSNPKMLQEYPMEVLKMGVENANTSIGNFKLANEQLFGGFGVCLTACLIINGKFHIVHCGNTRTYLIRHAKDGGAVITQITNDHTSAKKMVDEGTLSEEEYYAHPARLKFTSGLGFVPEPTMQMFSASMRKGDILLLTTDGIHYSIKAEPMKNIILQSNSWKDAVATLIEGAKLMEMEDNMTAMLIYLL